MVQLVAVGDEDGWLSTPVMRKMVVGLGVQGREIEYHMVVGFDFG